MSRHVMLENLNLSKRGRLSIFEPKPSKEVLKAFQDHWNCLAAPVVALSPLVERNYDSRNFNMIIYDI